MCQTTVKKKKLTDLTYEKGKNNTSDVDVTLIKTLWSGEQESSQKRFKKLRRQAGHPTRKGTAYICQLEVHPKPTKF